MTYVIVAVLLILSIPLNSWVSSQHDDKWWSPIVYIATMPGCALALLLLAILSIPYFFLYPERHAHILDFRGSDEQKLALKNYREESARRGICRRTMENFGLMKYSGPEWPDILNDIPDEDESAES